MELKRFLEIIMVKKRLIFACMGFFLLLGLIFSFAQPLKYRSSIKLLVVQNSTSGSSDAYAMMRSTEYLSKVLTKVTYSTTFADKVFVASGDIDRAYFGDTAKKLSKTWEKTVESKNVNETGIMEINVYHTNREQAEKIVRSIGAILITQNNEYHGMGESIKVKLLDQPITTNYPVKPNLPVNMAIALFTGLFVALAWLYLANYDSDNKLNYSTNSNQDADNHDYYPSQKVSPKSDASVDQISGSLAEGEIKEFSGNEATIDFTDNNYYSLNDEVDALFSRRLQ